MGRTLALVAESRRQQGVDAAVGQLVFVTSLVLWWSELRLPTSGGQALTTVLVATLATLLSAPVLRWLFDCDYCNRLDQAYRGVEEG